MQFVKLTDTQLSRVFRLNHITDTRGRMKDSAEWILKAYSFLIPRYAHISISDFVALITTHYIVTPHLQVDLTCFLNWFGAGSVIYRTFQSVSIRTHQP